ncbi:MAG TPA: TRAP transporter substrate-binding protein [Atribacterota bacterium]|nr:TRAP transporter substrate-binding protein [Atribacterota bacterium]
MFRRKLMIVLILSVVTLFSVVFQGNAVEPEYKFITGTMHPAAHPYNVALKWMAEEAEKRSGGRVKIDLYMNGQLGSELEMLQNAMMGKEINLLNVSCGNIAPLVPEMDFFALPYLFADYPKFEEAIFGDVGDIITDLLLKRDLIMIGMFTSGDRNLLLVDKKVMSPDDLKDFKMRVFKSPINFETWKIQGANPVVVAFAELYTALQTGVVDGAEQDFTATFNNKFNETIKYIALTHHLFMPNPLIIPRKTWESLPEDIQTLMLELGKETSEIFFEAQKSLEQEYAKVFEEEGIEIYEVDRKPFIEATIPLVERFSQENGLTWVYDIVKKYQ